ncbi:MAG: AmmeMemoRadiSam system protein A [Candidatus Omnitrophota bacterium]|nr:AmmeMemoRadiSam system protein A [Candidatus Omnitrophota bacterium]
MKQGVFLYTVIVTILFLSICLSLPAMDEKYTLKEKQYLLNLARRALGSYLKNGIVPEVQAGSLPEILKEKRACFVTLTERGHKLRGCIGLFEAKAPLYENVINRAIAAATKDPRFSPVTYDELKDIGIEISVLTLPEELKFDSPQDLLSKLQPKEDGVIIYSRYGSSTYLPQVWQQIPDKEIFLSHLCNKQGIPFDYWRTNYKDIRVEIYHAIVFSEKQGGL